MEELFDTFDDEGEFVGLLPRSEVHRSGAWHRSVHVLVFRSNGEVIVQRRADRKDLYPGLLDYSVGEHLQPGEDYEEAAIRGLHEELGIVGNIPQEYDLETRLEYVDEDKNIRDFEISRIFSLVYDGRICFDTTEISEVFEWKPSWIEREMKLDRSQFTSWFLKDLETLRIIATE